MFFTYDYFDIAAAALSFLFDITYSCTTEHPTAAILELVNSKAVRHV